MYCRNCGKELPEGSKFCPSCGSATAPEQSGPRSSAPSWGPMQIDPKLLLIAAGVVIVVLLLVVILRPGQSKAPVPGDTSQVQQQDPEPEPDPAAALVGTWTNKDGVGLKFTKDGTLKLSGLGLSLGGDTFTYETDGAGTLTLTASVAGVSADVEAPYTIFGDTLYIELGGVELTLTKK